MSFVFKACNRRDIAHFIQKYVGALSSPIDTFLEQQILNSDFYEISCHAAPAGYYAVNSDQCLTQFYLDPPYIAESQEIFNNVIRRHQVRSMLIPTCDELFLSLALDLDVKIEKQAYFFQDAKTNIPADKLYPHGEFKAAEVRDAADIAAMCRDFIGKVEERIENGELFTFTQGDVLLGIGIVERNKLLDGYGSLGVFTNPSHRNQGIGRTIIHHLKAWCYDHNLVPVCGCWYYNAPSKQTLESAGMASKTRLLNLKTL